MKNQVMVISWLLFVTPMMLGASLSLEAQRSQIRCALVGALVASHDNMTDLPLVGGNTDVTTWEGFLGGNETLWTMEEKKNAFLMFLESMGTNNLVAASDMDKEIARVAIEQCEDLAFTNSVPALKCIGLNPNGVYREDAISLAITMGELNGDMISFVDTIMTNSVSFTFRERGAACAKLASRALAVSSMTNSPNVTICRQIASMLYRNRNIDTAGAIMLDDLFCSQYDGYASSSNRLEYARFILAHPNCQPYNTRDFTAITNQLLSSGQPLRWINVGGTSE